MKMTMKPISTTELFSFSVKSKTREGMNCRHTISISACPHTGDSIATIRTIVITPLNRAPIYIMQGYLLERIYLDSILLSKDCVMSERSLEGIASEYLNRKLN